MVADSLTILTGYNLFDICSLANYNVQPFVSAFKFSVCAGQVEILDFNFLAEATSLSSDHRLQHNYIGNQTSGKLDLIDISFMRASLTDHFLGASRKQVCRFTQNIGILF